MFKEQAPSCVLVGVLTRERVSGASSLVCTGLKIIPNRFMLQKLLEISYSLMDHSVRTQTLPLQMKDSFNKVRPFFSIFMEALLHVISLYAIILCCFYYLNNLGKTSVQACC